MVRIAVLSWESLYSIAVGGVAGYATELAAAPDRRVYLIHVLTRRALGQAGHDRTDDVHYHRCTYPPPRNGERVKTEEYSHGRWTDKRGQTAMVLPDSDRGKVNYDSNRFPLDVDYRYRCICDWHLCV